MDLSIGNFDVCVTGCASRDPDHHGSRRDGRGYGGALHGARRLSGQFHLYGDYSYIKAMPLYENHSVLSKFNEIYHILEKLLRIDFTLDMTN